MIFNFKKQLNKKTSFYSKIVLYFICGNDIIFHIFVNRKNI